MKSIMLSIHKGHLWWLPGVTLCLATVSSCSQQPAPLVSGGQTAPETPAPEIRPSDLASMKTLTIEEGQRIRLQLAHDVSTAWIHNGEPVRYHVHEDVLGPDGEKLIYRGAPASGKVTATQRARALNREPLLHFAADFAIARDGSRIPLRPDEKASVSIQRRKGGLTPAPVHLPPGALERHGPNLIVKQGTIIDVFVDHDSRIKVKTE